MRVAANRFAAIAVVRQQFRFVIVRERTVGIGHLPDILGHPGQSGAMRREIAQGDLAQATSSASTKLFHGGLRYLEYFEFRLVREALEERETLLVAMPHISWPMRFVLPYHPDMRFEGDTPTGRLLSDLTAL